MMANWQWSAINESNRISTRPYIKITMKPEAFAIHTAGDTKGDFPGIKFRMENTGKLPGLVFVQSSASWGYAGRSGDDKNWPSIGIMARKFVFSGPDETEFPSYLLGFTKGQLADIATGDRYFVMLNAIYGPSKKAELSGPSDEYQTKVCTVFQVRRDGDVVKLDDGEPCPSEGSNYAK
jgi:hypothetical protein